MLARMFGFAANWVPPDRPTETGNKTCKYFRDYLRLWSLCIKLLNLIW